MARYIEANALVREMTLQANRTALGEIAPPDLSYSEMLEIIADAPTADVAPKSEVDNLEYTLMGVMHFVDKWLDGDELNQHEVNRAATMREKTLQIVERLQDEADRYKRYYFRHDYDEMIAEVLDKLDRFINSNCIEIKDERGIKGYVTSGVHFAIAEFKKKYTEGATDEIKR